MADITIKDIAKICGVGISTVSRAINNDPGIKEDTKKRILEVIEEYHYIPNNSARHLKMTESNTIALLVKGIDNQFFQGMLKIFEEELKQLKYTFLLHAVGEQQKSMDIAVELAKEKRLKGVIFLGGRIDTTDNRLKNMGIPYVMCTVAVDMTASERDCSSVSIDDEKESYRVVDYLCKKGHTKIAIIAGRDNDLAVGGMRLKGYKQALRDHGVDTEENLIFHMKHEIPEYSIENGYIVTKELLESQVSFTALYAISDLTAFGAYKAILEAGKKIPDDYSVIGFDGIDISKYFHPSLTTMKQPCEEMVKSSIKLLMEAIHGNDEKKQCIFQANLIERESVRALK
ncbi:MAG: LacI family transcriptional regulator [Eubacterium sp.]|nr:LacI family transcriptional regulator [Eubacterium sp.]